jgi:hypothetical protein
MSKWVDEKVICLITSHFLAQNQSWAVNVQTAVQRGVLKKIYVTLPAGANAPYAVAELAKAMVTCGARLVSHRKHALVKVMWIARPPVQLEGDAA